MQTTKESASDMTYPCKKRGYLPIAASLPGAEKYVASVQLTSLGRDLGLFFGVLVRFLGRGLVETGNSGFFDVSGVYSSVCARLDECWRGEHMMSQGFGLMKGKGWL